MVDVQRSGRAKRTAARRVPRLGGTNKLQTARHFSDHIPPTCEEPLNAGACSNAVVDESPVGESEKGESGDSDQRIPDSMIMHSSSLYNISSTAEKPSFPTGSSMKDDFGDGDFAANLGFLLNGKDSSVVVQVEACLGYRMLFIDLIVVVT